MYETFVIKLKYNYMNNHKSSDVRKLAIEYYNQRNVSQKENMSIILSNW